MTHVAILADYHGPGGVAYADTFATKFGCSRVLQCGDFWAYDVIAERPHNFLRGNHEIWRRIGQFRNGERTGSPTMRFQDDYTIMELDNTTIGFVGGIQPTAWHKNNIGMLGGVRAWQQTGWGKIPKSFEERIWVRPPTEQEMMQLESCDVLLFHDKPWMTPQHGGKNVDLLTDLVKAVKPELVCHGHMHLYTRSQHAWEDGRQTEIIELPPCDGDAWQDNYAGLVQEHVVGVVLDTVKREWTIESMDHSEVPGHE